MRTYPHQGCALRSNGYWERSWRYCAGSATQPLAAQLQTVVCLWQSASDAPGCGGPYTETPTEISPSGPRGSPPVSSHTVTEWFPYGPSLGFGSGPLTDPLNLVPAHDQWRDLVWRVFALRAPSPSQVSVRTPRKFNPERGRSRAKLGHSPYPQIQVHEGMGVWLPRQSLMAVSRSHADIQGSAAACSECGGLNVVRLNAWLQGRPRATARRSHLVRLMAA